MEQYLDEELWEHRQIQKGYVTVDCDLNDPEAMAKLQTLSFHKKVLSLDDLNNILEALEKSTSLKRLFLSDVGPEFTSAILERLVDLLLMEGCSVREFSIACNFDDYDDDNSEIVTQIARLVAANRNVTLLDIFGLQLMEGMDIIVESLKENSVLEHISLAGNILCKQNGLSEFFGWVEGNTTLKTVNLGGLLIGGEEGDIEHLVPVLQNNKTLESIEMGESDLTDEDIVEIVKALRHNTTLKKLDLEDNGDLTNVIAKEISKLLSGQDDSGNKIYPYPGLVNVNLRRNGLTPESIAMLCAAITTNPTILQLPVEDDNQRYYQADTEQLYDPILKRNQLLLRPILTWEDFEVLEQVEEKFPSLPQAVQIIHQVKEEIQEIFEHHLKNSPKDAKLNAMFTLPDSLRSKIFTKLSFADLVPYCEACPSMKRTLYSTKLKRVIKEQ